MWFWGCHLRFSRAWTWKSIGQQSRRFFLGRRPIFFLIYLMNPAFSQVATLKKISYNSTIFFFGVTKAPIFAKLKTGWKLKRRTTLKVGNILQNLPSNHFRDPNENKVVNNDCCVRVRIAIFKRQSFMLRNNPFSSVACSDVICLIWAIW